MNARRFVASTLVFALPCALAACAQTLLLEAPAPLGADGGSFADAATTETNGVREPEVLARNLGGVIGISVDGAYVYVACYDDKSAFAVPKSGGTPIELGRHTTAVLDVTSDASRVYWSVAASSNQGGPPGKILSLPIANLAGTVVTHASGPNLTPWSLANDETRIYYGNDAVMAIDKSTGTTTQVGGGEISTPVFVTADSVYWVSRFEGVVRAASKDGSDVRTLASAGAQAITSVAADEAKAYFLENDGVRGHVYSVPIHGGARQELASSTQTGFSLSIDAEYIYWTTLAGGAVSRVAKAGGAAELLSVNAVSPELRGGAITNDSAFVYYATGDGNLFRLRK